MKIGILCYPTSGGSGVVASEVGASLAARGHDVHIVSYAPPFRAGPASARLRFHRVQIPQYPLFEYPSYGMAAACALASAVEDYDLEILHAHYAYPHAVSAYLARAMTRRRNLRIVTTLHGTDIALVRQDAAFEGLTRFGIVESDAVTAVSEFLRSSTASWFGLERPIEVIPNFVDTARFRPRPRRPRPPTLVHVSNFRPVKRSGDAVRVLRLVRRRVPARLRLIGTGPEREEIRKLADRLGLGEHVEFAGEERRIERALAEADVFLSTSEFEGFGLAALEAMACGVPVVATQAGGIAEVVLDGRTGYLAPVGDVDALAERVTAVLEDRALARRLGTEARAKACDDFDTQRVLPRYERLYERLVGSSAAAMGGGARA